jgi:flagellin
MTALQSEITRISDTTSFGGQKLIDGSFGTKKFQVGADADQTINVNLRSTAAHEIGNYVSETPGTAFGVQISASTITSTLSAGDELIISGENSSYTHAAQVNETADATAKAINEAGTGVTAEAVATAVISDIGAGDAGTLTVGDQDFELANYPNAEKLTQALSEAGFNATVDDDGVITLEAKGVSGIMLVGGGTDTAQLNSVVGGTGQMSTATLELSSSNEFSFSGAQVGSFVSAAGAGTLVPVDEIDLKTQESAQSAIAIIDGALAQIDGQRAELGAVQNRFSHTISNLANIQENVSASRSRIQDTDFAVETANMTKNQILQQAGTSILAQANQIPQAAISLIGG